MDLCLFLLVRFLDETGTDRRDTLRRYAYSWRGKPALAQKVILRGERLSSIAIMSTTGVLDCKITTGTVDEVMTTLAQVADLVNVMIGVTHRTHYPSYRFS